MDTLRRGEVYNAMIETAGVLRFTWMMIKGNREAAWLYDAGICLRYVIDPQCGAMHCSVCRQKYPDFVKMRAGEHDFIGNQTVFLKSIVKVRGTKESATSTSTQLAP